MLKDPSLWVIDIPVPEKISVSSRLSAARRLKERKEAKRLKAAAAAQAAADAAAKLTVSLVPHVHTLKCDRKDKVTCF